MDQIDELIRDIVSKYMDEDHGKISAKTLSRELDISCKIISYHLRAHPPEGITVEKRGRGLIAIKERTKLP
jgi:predicted transcriptional regulator